MTIPKNPYSPVPLDFAMLELLPERGQIGGVHWKGRRAADLVAEIGDRNPEAKGLVTVHQAQSRLRTLRMYGYAEHFPGARGKIWARTTLGTELMARKEEVLR